MGHKVKKIYKTRGETSDFSRLTFETNCYVKVQQNPKSFIEAPRYMCVMFYVISVWCEVYDYYIRYGLCTPSYSDMRLKSVKYGKVANENLRWQSSKESFFLASV